MNIVHDMFKDFWCDVITDEVPKDRRMEPINGNGVYGHNTENIRFVINEMVRVFAGDGCYFEVGTLKGASLLSAGLYNKSCLCVGMDNFSELNGEDNYPTLLQNLAKFNLNNVRFVRGEFFRKAESGRLKSFLDGKPIDVYFYDGPHDEYLQYQGLSKILPYLNEKCIIMVDDINWIKTETPTDAFAKENKFDILLKIRRDTYPSNWWNGFQVMGRGI